MVGSNGKQKVRMSNMNMIHKCIMLGYDLTKQKSHNTNPKNPSSDKRKEIQAARNNTGFFLISIRYMEFRNHSKNRVSKKYLKTSIINLIWCIVVLVGFCSCSTTQPMTQYINRQASEVGKITNFQYYVSRNIILVRTEDPEIVGKVAVSGEVKATFIKGIIQITSSTKRALLKTEQDESGN
jgi:hypothetical protein